MPIPAKVTVIGKAPDLEKTKQEGLTISMGLQGAATTLKINTATDYETADAILGRVRVARKTWGERMERIIRPMRTALDEVYGLNREVDKPLAAVEETIKGKMKAFKLEEQRQIQAAQREQQEEADRLRREQEEKARLAETARTAQLRGKMAAQAERLTEKVAEVEARETPAPVLVNSSSTRNKKIAKVTDVLAFCGGVSDGTIPHDVVAILAGPMAKHLKDSPEDVAQWPGVEVVDDIQIVGR